VISGRGSKPMQMEPSVQDFASRIRTAGVATRRIRLWLGGAVLLVAFGLLVAPYVPYPGYRTGVLIFSISTTSLGIAILAAVLVAVPAATGFRKFRRNAIRKQLSTLPETTRREVLRAVALDSTAEVQEMAESLWRNFFPATDSPREVVPTPAPVGDGREIVPPAATGALSTHQTTSSGMPTAGAVETLPRTRRRGLSIAATVGVGVALFASGILTAFLWLFIGTRDHTVDRTADWSELYRGRVQASISLPPESQVSQALETNVAFFKQRIEFTFRLPNTRSPEAWVRSIAQKSAFSDRDRVSPFSYADGTRSDPSSRGVEYIHRQGVYVAWVNLDFD